MLSHFVMHYTISQQYGASNSISEYKSNKRPTYSSVTLQCEFVLASDNLAHTEIEWIIVPSDRDKDEDVIIWYTGGIIYDNLYGPLKQRVHFTSPEPQDGIASITVTDLKHTDSGTYQCKVKKLPDIASKNLILSVMERPSKPVCSVEGQAVAGRDLRFGPTHRYMSLTPCKKKKKKKKKKKRSHSCGSTHDCVFHNYIHK
uniref:Ig-like domain-containing protein n=1 Tax=Echeneis naucrates TaxID=173247 RepID=A0A665UDZ3_ECHNA